MTQRPLPNLFIVGAAKCGTTSLHYYLSQHPRIFMSDPKELRFWCKDLHREADQYHFGRVPVPAYRAARRLMQFLGLKLDRRFWSREQLFPIRRLEDYLARFPLGSDYRYFGESSPDYLWSSTAAREIAAFNPDAKIIIILREPTEYLHSLYLELLSGPQGEDVAVLEDALSLEQERQAGRSLPKNVRFPSSVFYLANSRFTQQIKRYTDNFPADQIRLLLLDDVRANVTQVYEGLLAFLGLNAEGQTFDLAIMNRTAGSETPTMSDATRDRLKRHFRGEVESLCGLFDRDLIDLWGYQDVAR